MRFLIGGMSLDSALVSDVDISGVVAVPSAAEGCWPAIVTIARSEGGDPYVH